MEQGWCKFETSGNVYDYLRYKEELEQVDCANRGIDLSQGETKCEVQCSSNWNGISINSHWGI